MNISQLEVRNQRKTNYIIDYDSLYFNMLLIITCSCYWYCHFIGPLLPGDPGEPTTLTYDGSPEPIIIKVEGWTFEAVQRGKSDELVHIYLCLTT